MAQFPDEALGLVPIRLPHERELGAPAEGQEVPVGLGQAQSQPWPILQFQLELQLSVEGRYLLPQLLDARPQLLALIIQLASLINLLQNEVKPILKSTNETVNTLRGTSEFLSENLVEPVIKLNSYLAGLKKLFDLFGINRK